MFASHDIEKNAYSMFLNFNTIQYNAMLNNKMQHNTIQDNTLHGNPDGFETVWKMGNDIEKSRQFWHSPKIVKLWENLDSS